MFSIEKQVDIVGSRQVFAKAEHSARMTLAEKGGRAIMRVLSKDARVISVSALLSGADVEVSGRVICSALCEISGGEVVMLEYLGAFNFSHKALGMGVPAGCDASAIVAGVRVLRASGCEVALEVDFDITENFSVQTSETAVVSAVDCYSEVEKIKAVNSQLKVHNFTAIAEMEVGESVSQVLFQQFYCECTGVSVGSDSAVCSGNIHGWISFLDIAGNLRREACSFPFREEFSAVYADEYSVSCKACECSVICEVNEVKGVSVVTCEVEVEISLWGFSAVEFEKGRNFFSDKLEMRSEESEFICSDFCGMSQSSGKFAEIFDWPFDAPSGVEVVCARIAGVKRKGDGATFACEVVASVASGDMKFQEYTVICDVVFPVSAEGKTGVCDACICEISSRIVSGRVEVFGRVAGNLMLVSERKEAICSALYAGEAKADACGGFVLYRAEKGEGLLDVCTAVGVMPDVLKAQNPGVIFPVMCDTKVVVWKGGR